MKLNKLDRGTGGVPSAPIGSTNEYRCCKIILTTVVLHYRLQRSCGQGYVFTRVCDSVHWGSASRDPLPRRPLCQGAPPKEPPLPRRSQKETPLPRRPPGGGNPRDTPLEGGTPQRRPPCQGDFQKETPWRRHPPGDPPEGGTPRRPPWKEAPPQRRPRCQGDPREEAPHPKETPSRKETPPAYGQ